MHGPKEIHGRDQSPATGRAQFARGISNQSCSMGSSLRQPLLDVTKPVTSNPCLADLELRVTGFARRREARRSAALDLNTT
jgi:hypothetical protein